MQSYLAFGDDEETLNLGAKAISDHLKAQGVTLEFSLDEGGGKIEPGAAFGAPDISIAHVDLMEKGLRGPGVIRPLCRRPFQPSLRRYVPGASGLRHRRHHPQTLSGAAQPRDERCL